MIDWKTWKAVGITAGALIGVATLYNNYLIPFLNSNYSPVAGTIRIQAIEAIQQKTVETLAATNETVQDTVERLDRTACSDWNRRLRNAGEALMKNPNDQFAEDQYKTAYEQIKITPMCGIELAR